MRTHWVYHVFIDKFVRILNRLCVSVACSTPAILCTFWYIIKRYVSAIAFHPHPVILSESVFSKPIQVTFVQRYTFFASSVHSDSSNGYGYIVPIALHTLFHRYYNINTESQSSASLGSFRPNVGLWVFLSFLIDTLRVALFSKQAFLPFFYKQETLY